MKLLGERSRVSLVLSPTGAAALPLFDVLTARSDVDDVLHSLARTEDKP